MRWIYVCIIYKILEVGTGGGWQPPLMDRLMDRQKSKHAGTKNRQKTSTAEKKTMNGQTGRQIHMEIVEIDIASGMLADIEFMQGNNGFPGNQTITTFAV